MPATAHEQFTASAMCLPNHRFDGFVGRWYTTDAGTCNDDSASDGSGDSVDQVISTIGECNAAHSSLVASGALSSLRRSAYDYSTHRLGPSRPRGCWRDSSYWGTYLRFNDHPDALRDTVDQRKSFICTNGVQGGAVSVPHPASSTAVERGAWLALSSKWNTSVGSRSRSRSARLALFLSCSLTPKSPWYTNLPRGVGGLGCSSRKCMPVCTCGPGCRSLYETTASSGSTVVLMHRCSLHRADWSPDHP